MSLHSVGLHRELGFAHRYGPQESRPQKLLVMLWGLPRAIKCPALYRVEGATLACVQRKQALPKTWHLGKANDAVRWLLVRKPWETLLTLTYSDIFIMGYHSLCLRMRHLRHFPLYSESFLKGRTAFHLSALPQFPCCPWHQMGILMKQRKA